jgi:hypothetical protein
MTNPKTKLKSDKAQNAVNAYINNTIINPTVGYTWAQAMRDAGYAETTIDKQSNLIWGYEGLQDQIEQARADIKAKSIKSRTERQAWWSAVVDNNEAALPDRLRASELLGRSEADFTDNIANTVEDQTKTLTKAEQIESLRSQIRLLDDTGDAGTAVAS